MKTKVVKGGFQQPLQSNSARKKLMKRTKNFFAISLPNLLDSKGSLVAKCYADILTRPPEQGVTVEDLYKLETNLQFFLEKQLLLKKKIKYKRKLLGFAGSKVNLYCYKDYLIAKKKYSNKKKYKEMAATGSMARLIPRIRCIPAVVVRSHMLDRYMLSVDHFCGYVNRDNGVFVEDLMKEISRKLEFKIPEILEHFSFRWSEKTIKSEQYRSSPYNLSEARSITDLCNHFIKQLKTVPSSLQDNLLKAFSEANLDLNTETNQVPTDGELTFSANQVPTDEGELSDELCEFNLNLIQEFLNRHTQNGKESMVKDPVISTIKKSIACLSHVNDYNITELNKIQEVMVSHIKGQEIEESLAEVDEEILKMYKKIVNSEKKSETQVYDRFYKLSAEDEASAKKALKQHNALQGALTDIMDLVNL